jgi:hypothetical protein
MAEADIYLRFEREILLFTHTLRCEVGDNDTSFMEGEDSTPVLGAFYEPSACALSTTLLQGDRTNWRAKIEFRQTVVGRGKGVEDLSQR